MSRNIVSSHELRALDIELAKFYKNINYFSMQVTRAVNCNYQEQKSKKIDKKVLTLSYAYGIIRMYQITSENNIYF